MVFYFMPRGPEGFLLYMGRDKYENEDLIKYALPHDIWFHVDDLSSAHVYLRMPLDLTIDSIPADALEDACQLVKANSIQGHKINNLDIVYTPAPNLRKTPAMDVGQVSFKNQKEVKKVRVERRINDVVNRLNRTKKEIYPDLAAERSAWDKEQRGKAKAQAQAQVAVDRVAKEQQKKVEELRSYTTIMREEDMTTVKEMREKYARPEDYEDDFM